MRRTLHSIFHNLLINVESRNSVLMYFSAILRQSEKRTQIHSDEKLLALIPIDAKKFDVALPLLFFVLPINLIRHSVAGCTIVICSI